MLFGMENSSSFLLRDQSDPKSGTLTTAEGYDDKVEGTVVAGDDWLLIDADGAYARPNVKLVVELEDGINIQCSYTAVVAVSQAVLEFMAGAPNAKSIPFGAAISSYLSTPYPCHIFHQIEN
ncbi:Uncharacterized protein family UPF0311 [Penicillium occitanis (nom. inval.)]|nr:Uncharacterized protein family UPF0311 [Penicillium occitanis (nom. inval.)]PCH02723.1 hypothetical protein PENOC_042160 [Penicillium occitanis (nom. inval.)]